MFTRYLGALTCVAYCACRMPWTTRSQEVWTTYYSPFWTTPTHYRRSCLPYPKMSFRPHRLLACLLRLSLVAQASSTTSLQRTLATACPTPPTPLYTTLVTPYPWTSCSRHQRKRFSATLALTRTCPHPIPTPPTPGTLDCLPTIPPLHTNRFVLSHFWRTSTYTIFLRVIPHILIRGYHLYIYIYLILIFYFPGSKSYFSRSNAQNNLLYCTMSRI